MFGTSVCHQNVQETNTETNHEVSVSVKMFCDVCWNVCGANCLRSGTLEIDFCTRIMPLLTALSLQEFQANNGMTAAPHPPSYTSIPWHFYVSKLKLALKWYVITSRFKNSHRPRPLLLKKKEMKN